MRDMEEYIEHDLLGIPSEKEEMELYNYLSFKFIHEFGVPDRYSSLVSGAVRDVRKLLDFDLKELCYFDGSFVFTEQNSEVLDLMIMAISSIDLGVSLQANLHSSFVNYVVRQELEMFSNRTVEDYGISDGFSRYLVTSSPATLYNVLFDRVVSFLLIYTSPAVVDCRSRLDSYLREIVQEVSRLPVPKLSERAWVGELERIVDMNVNELGYSFRHNMRLLERLEFHNSLTGHPLGNQLKDGSLSSRLSITKLLSIRFMECASPTVVSGVFSDLLHQISEGIGS